MALQWIYFKASYQDFRPSASLDFANLKQRNGSREFSLSVQQLLVLFLHLKERKLGICHLKLSGLLSQSCRRGGGLSWFPQQNHMKMSPLSIQGIRTTVALHNSSSCCGG